MAEAAVHRMVKRAVEMEGTVTGEHGVGLVKRDYLNHELGETTVDVMRKVRIPKNNELKVFNANGEHRSSLPSTHCACSTATRLSEWRLQSLVRSLSGKSPAEGHSLGKHYIPRAQEIRNHTALSSHPR